MKRATRKLRGVIRTTKSDIHRFLENMKTSVTPMVTTPEKSWVKPKSSPSERVSISVMTLLTMSPAEWVSR